MKLMVGFGPEEVELARWRIVCEFDAARRHEVEDAAAALVRAAGLRGAKIINDDRTVRYLNDRGMFRAAGGQS